jgi:hypothetical protein
MLRFQTTPTKLQKKIIEEALSYDIDTLSETFRFCDTVAEANKEFKEWCFYRKIEKIWGSDAHGYHRLLKKLYLAHIDPKNLYCLTDYHFLVLYHITQGHCECHNDYRHEEGYEGDRREYKWYNLVDELFFDIDFLLPPDTINALSEDNKNMMGIADATFGVCNNLKPHSEETLLLPMNGKEFPETKGLKRDALDDILDSCKEPFWRFVKKFPKMVVKEK